MELDRTQIILGSKINKESIDTDTFVNIELNQQNKELFEFDRTSDVNLAQVFDDERQKSTTFRPVGKFTIIFENTLSGFTNYTPFKNNIYYTNPISNQINQITAATPSNVFWEGLPQAHEFDFIREDNNVPGYTTNLGPTTPHLYFVNKSATTYNWTFFVSYPYENNFNKQMYIIDDKSLASWSWVASDGIPYIIEIGSDQQENNIKFRCPVKHGLTQYSYVKLSTNYNGDEYFQVTSLGDSGFDSQQYVFNITNIGYTGTTFLTNQQGTLKKIINPNNPETISEYYVRKHKLLTNVEDCVLTKTAFEENIFNKKTKRELAVLTPNNTNRISVKDITRTYNLSLNVDIEIKDLIDNQKRPLSELFFTTIWKGYFGWTNSLKSGWEFNQPLYLDKPNPWWQNSLSNTNYPTTSYFSNVLPTQGPFVYTNNFKSGDTIDGDYCEWNNYEQIERVISRYNHKITFNENWFDLQTNADIGNQYGYYYYPHNPMTIKVYSNYIEKISNNGLLDIPTYSFYSNLSNGFIWRDIYPYGFVDSDGRGVDFPFLNGAHYPYENFVFRIIPEGSNINNPNITTIQLPTEDECQ
jgi:hypothetical protein